MPYQIILYDCAGEFCSWDYETFEDAIAVYPKIKKLYPKKVIRVFNRDKCDLNFNGLTDEERNILNEID